VIKNNEALLFRSPRQVVLGNREATSPCGILRLQLRLLQTRASRHADVIKDDPKLKFVLKELPILGPGSVEAARVAVAVRMQDTGGEKYLAFHQNMMGTRGQANRKRRSPRQGGRPQPAAARNRHGERRGR